MLGAVEPLAALIEDLEPDGKSVPALLRQYLKFGGRVLGFNVDELALEFANREMAEVGILGDIASAGRDVAAAGMAVLAGCASMAPPSTSRLASR